MYTLRRITPEPRQTISNCYLGNRYEFVHKDRNKAEYDAIYESIYQIHPDKPCTVEEAMKRPGAIAFIVDKDLNYYPLYGGDESYIVMDDGRTFERLKV